MNIGRSLPRRENAALLTGAGTFLDDLKPDAVTYARFVRSSVAHAQFFAWTRPLPASATACSRC